MTDDRREPGPADLEDDFAIRSMLVARADRVHPAAQHEILTAVATELTRSPSLDGRVGDSLTVAVRPVAGPADRRSRTRLWASIAAVAALAVAVVGLAILPQNGNRASPSPRVPVPSVPGAPLPSGDPNLAAFAASLASGSLDGRVVVLVGRFDPNVIECPGSNGGCLQGVILGLPDVIVTSAPGPLGISQAATGAANRELAFRVAGTSLAFLGSLQQDPSSPITVNQLVGSPPPSDRLAVVSGTLHYVPVETCPPLTAKPCVRDARLALFETRPSGGLPNAGVVVGADDRLVQEASANPSGVTATFLVAFDPTLQTSTSALDPPGFFGSLRIVGQVDDSLVQVAPSSAPAARPSPSATALPEGVLSADDLRQLVQDAGALGTVVIVDGQLSALAVPCPRTALCYALTLHGLEGVPIDAEAPVDMERAQSVPVYGQLALRIEPGRMAYLGIVPDPLEPMTIPDLLASDLAPSSQLAEVAGWLDLDPTHACPVVQPFATPCPGSAPVIVEPGTPSDVAFGAPTTMDVTLDPGLSSDTPGTPIAGPLLVRRTDRSPCPSPGASACPAASSGWEVVAVVGAGSITRALLR